LAGGTVTGTLDISYGHIALNVGADGGLSTRTDETIKYGRLGCPHYTNAEQPLAFIYAYSTSTGGTVTLGGGSNQFNAATILKFYTAANNTTTTGTSRMEIQSDGSIDMPAVYGDSHGGTGRVMYIQDDGQLTCDTSSIRYKENVRDLDDTSILYSLRPVEFDWKNGGLKNDVGLIAEEVEAIDSRFVSYGRKEIIVPYLGDEDFPDDIRYIEDKTKVGSVHSQKFIPILIAEIQNLRSEVDLLKAEIEILKRE